MSKRNPPVVIYRKSKRLNRPAHIAAFLLTGGMSAPISAAKAATNAGYNARTRELAARAEAEDYLDEMDGQSASFTAEDRELGADAVRAARDEMRQERRAQRRGRK